jgi:hypothetical protein
MTLQQRYQSPTPKFFKRVSKWGLALAAVGGTLLTTPIPHPPLLVKLAVNVTVAGAVATRLRQAPTPVEEENE